MKYTTGPGMTAQLPLSLGVTAELIGVQFLSLGLMGEILARVYFESQGKLRLCRPGYDQPGRRRSPAGRLKLFAAPSAGTGAADLRGGRGQRFTHIGFEQRHVRHRPDRRTRRWVQESSSG